MALSPTRAADRGLGGANGLLRTFTDFYGQDGASYHNQRGFVGPVGLVGLVGLVGQIAAPGLSRECFRGWRARGRPTADLAPGRTSRTIRTMRGLAADRYGWVRISSDRYGGMGGKNDWPSRNRPTTVCLNGLLRTDM